MHRENTFTLVVNSGRSGSTYIASILRENFPEVYVAHEDIPIGVSLATKYSRCYSDEDYQTVLQDPKLMFYLNRWKERLTTHDIVETGWTAAHLAPVLSRFFEGQFRYVILHRHPFNVALSRANMGCYHPSTFYKGREYEVSPFDIRSICPEKQAQWAEMNHVEKCLYWWYTFYLDAYEFKTLRPELPSMELSSEIMFTQEGVADLIDFLSLPNRKINSKGTKNEVGKFSRETFPIFDEWKSLPKHTDIIDFAKMLGYRFDSSMLEKQAKRYELPAGLGPKLRYKTKYWKLKSSLKRLLRL